MTDPHHDDDWQDLFRELGMEESHRPAAPVAADVRHEPAPEPDLDQEDHGSEIESEADEFASGIEADAESGDEVEAAGDEAEGEDGEPGDGQPDPGKKRRRRRRRRKKGAGSDETGELPADTPEERPAAPAQRVRPVVTRAPAVDADHDDDAGDFDPDAETSHMPLAAEEDTGNDVLREMIATWNVPNWGDIVSGLYRPER